MTNNEVERDLRTWVSDRRRGFSAATPVARRAGDALTIITTCKKLGHDPRCYVRDTLKRILDRERDLNALLPEDYKPGGADAAGSTMYISKWGVCRVAD